MKVSFDVIERISFIYRLFFTEFIDYMLVPLRQVGPSTVLERVHQLSIFLLLWLGHEQFFNKFWIA